MTADPGLRCPIPISATNERVMLDAILAGTSGRVVKDIASLESIDAIREVGAVESLLDNRAAAALTAAAHRGGDEERGTQAAASASILNRSKQRDRPVRLGR
ncbi:hypothetical protein [Nocardia sp. NPDC052112]|uniref:hypothetical protein n=1 Tax=Nocardia sp. NPDC052112 TaxID=3155646 RepID=UPI0034436B06